MRGLTSICLSKKIRLDQSQQAFHSFRENQVGKSTMKCHVKLTISEYSNIRLEFTKIYMSTAVNFRYSFLGEKLYERIFSDLYFFEDVFEDRIT